MHTATLPGSKDGEDSRCSSSPATSSSTACIISPDTVLGKRLALFPQCSSRQDLTELRTAPLFTEPVRQHAVDSSTAPSGSLFSQYGVLANKVDDGLDYDNGDGLMYYNVAAPSSVFICGSQGSGKSHTLSCLLENCLIPSVANELPRPLTGIVFHYDTFSSDIGGSPCEAAFLSTHPNMNARVLCAPTNIACIRETYARFPDIEVEELRINETDLNTKRMMDLMAVKEGGSMPLYLHVVNRILRDLRLEQQRTGSSFQYAAFKRMIEAEQLVPGQRGPLIQRLDTLQSFMVREQVQSSGAAKKFKKASRSYTGNSWAPIPGHLTIVDLSCPCVTAETACSLFNICASLFLEQDTNVGRIIALDEAHKYMNESAEAGTLTDQLLSTIRLQRHLGARVVISTQEPTISPNLLDLCSVTIVHRFTSPAWLQALQRHLAGVSAVSRLLASVESGANGETDRLSHGMEALGMEDSGQGSAMAVFAQIVRLRVGEALLFAPSAVLEVDEGLRARKLNHGVLKVRMRKRITADGGQSVMAG
ncbi:unnamed protein product [Discula destructiva]